jgi:signal transduction histidine kinase
MPKTSTVEDRLSFPLSFSPPFSSSSSFRSKFPFLLGLIPALAVLSSYLYVHLVAPTFHYENARFVSVLDAVIALIAINLGILLLLLKRYRLSDVYPWASGALLAIGLLRLIASSIETVPECSWLKNLERALGALFFAMAWIPWRSVAWRKITIVPVVASLLSTSLGMFVFFFARLLPAATIADDYSPISNAFNIIAGLLFALACVLGGVHRQKQKEDYDLVLLNICLFSALGCLLSPLTHIWGPRWWLVQILEVFPFFVAFAYKFLLFKKLQNNLFEATKKLTRTNEDLGSFVSLASHDLQEPLRTISSHLTLLRRSYIAQPESKELLQFAIDGTRRMQTLVQDLVNYCRLGKDGIPPTPVDCSRLLQEVSLNLRSSISEADALIIGGKLPVLAGSRSQLTQLFQNLVSNALKYRGNRPLILSISAKKTDHDWVFTVADNGMGFSYEDADRIFLPFQRLHGKGEIPGSGIGLTTCRRIVELHGGKIWATGQKGVGASFHFTIPLEPFHAHSMPTEMAS